MPSKLVEHERRWLGVDRVVLYENDDTPRLKARLAQFIDSGFLVYNHEPQPNAQMKVYQDCIDAHAPDFNWLAFFDLDEFLLLRRCALVA